MKESIIEFQKQRIEALETENRLLKVAIVRKENSVKEYLKRLTVLINDPAFNKPIIDKNYESIQNVA